MLLLSLIEFLTSRCNIILKLLEQIEQIHVSWHVTHLVQSKWNVLSLPPPYTLRCRGEVPLYSSLRRSDNFGNSPQIAAPRRSREIDQSTQRFYVGWFHVGWQGIGQSLGKGFLNQESAVGRVPP